MQLSSEGLHFILRHEGFRDRAYGDEAGNATIGYGHKLLPGESYPDGISQSDARMLLARDAALAANVVKNNVRASMTQGQFDALVSLVFNIGAGEFEHSTLLKELNAGNSAEAANEFLKWNRLHKNGALVVDSGLTNRRYAERYLFLSGDYDCVFF